MENYISRSASLHNQRCYYQPQSATAKVRSVLINSPIAPIGIEDLSSPIHAPIAAKVSQMELEISGHQLHQNSKMGIYGHQYD